MIVYDGIDIQSIAGVKIEDVRVSAIEIASIVRPRAVNSGSVFVRSRYGTRTVSVTFALISQDMNQRQSSLMAISEWAKSDAEYKLELPGHPDHYLMAVCTGKPDPSLRQWWENKLRLVFTCYENPFWNDRIEKTVSCGTAFRVLGDVPPLMQITRTLGSSASNQNYSNGTQTMTFSTIPAGDMVIDLNNQTAYVGSSSIMSAYSVSSSFIIPKTGNQTITGTGTIKYRERWA